MPEVNEGRAVTEVEGEAACGSDSGVCLPGVEIGGLTVYICMRQLLCYYRLSADRLPLVGPPEYMRDESKELTLRVHDECMHKQHPFVR